MPELIIYADCPRCDCKKITFDPKGSNDISIIPEYSYEDHMQKIPPDPYRGMYELFAICRGCRKATVFIIGDFYNDERYDFPNVDPMGYKGLLNNYFEIVELLRMPDDKPCPPPKSIPKNIEKIFNEGAICLTKECWNAAGTMFRQCVDLATKEMLPEQGEKGLTKDKQGNLGPRITWLFDNKKLNERLKDLANCIKDDGNDGAHDGTLEEDDAEGLLNFTVMLLKDIYTTPAEIKEKKKKKENRKAKNAKS